MAKVISFKSCNSKMDCNRPVKGYKDGGIVERMPTPSEDQYFKSNKNVPGMMAQDQDAVVMNPYSKRTPQEMDAVRLNEMSRIMMRRQGDPNFALTPQQEKFLNSNSYKDASPGQRNATIAARILSGDPSAGTPTPEQLQYVNNLRKTMGK